jgi:hypothetical protein
LGRHSAAAPSRFRALSKHVAINVGVATECHPYKCLMFKGPGAFRTEVPLAARRSLDDATLITDSYFRWDV